MNIELYIQSGIVESYALGLANPLEVAEFEQLMPHFPELKEALSDFEYQLELFAIDNEEPPPPGTRERIEARIKEIPRIPVIPEIRPDTRNYRRQRATTEYVPAQVSSPFIKIHKNWLLALIILSKLLLAGAIYFFLEYQHTQKHVMQLEEQLGKKDGVEIK